MPSFYFGRTCINAKVSGVHKQEADKRTRATEIKASIEVLKAQINAGSGWSEEQERTKGMLLRQQEEMARELEMKNKGLIQLRTEVNHLHDIVQERDESKQALEQEIAGLKAGVAAKRTASEREQRRKDRLDKDLQNLRKQVS